MNEPKIKTIGNIVLVIIGLTTGIVLFLNGEKQLSSVLLSIAIASVLYQFLGGITAQNSVQLGAIKFGGSAAVLLGFIYFLNSFVFIEKEKVKFSFDHIIPIDLLSGKIKPITIETSDSTYVFPLKGDSDLFFTNRKKSELGLKYEDELYEVIAKDTTVIGTIRPSVMNKVRLYSTIVSSDGDMEVFKLKPGEDSRTNYEKTYGKGAYELPFKIVTNQNKFSIETVEGHSLQKHDFTNKELYSRKSYVIREIGSDLIYIVFLEQAKSTEGRDTWFSKWIIKEFKQQI